MVMGHEVILTAPAAAGLAPPSTSTPPKASAPASAVRRAVVSRVLIVSPPWAGMKPATWDREPVLDLGQGACPCRSAESPDTGLGTNPTGLSLTGLRSEFWFLWQAAAAYRPCASVSRTSGNTVSLCFFVMQT